MSTKSSNTDIPKKSIMKKGSTSSERVPQNEARRTKTARFDEENIKETYRPADKDYGFEEITEAKTPYEREMPPMDPNKLRERLMDFSHDTDDDDDQLGCTSSDNDRKRDSAASGTSSTSAASKRSVISTSLSITSGSSLSFEERRKKHIQAEYVLAKQVSTPDTGDQDACTKPECSEHKK